MTRIYAEEYEDNSLSRLTSQFDMCRQAISGMEALTAITKQEPSGLLGGDSVDNCIEKLSLLRLRFQSVQNEIKAHPFWKNKENPRIYIDCMGGSYYLAMRGETLFVSAVR